MTTVIEAIYENGTLKPLVATQLKERQRYTLIVQEKPTDILMKNGLCRVK